MTGLVIGLELGKPESDWRHIEEHWTRNWSKMMATGIGVGLELSELDSNAALVLRQHNLCKN